ncbi:MAG: hypothetical protein PHQ80_04400 [Candidatus ainarchaeum sp.]|nr:hypothetical protein [Candidatus ainarchaeum sp.]MDD5096812.1 hypothetical protein [Candidatus ainarchaeum sp.]
MQEKDIGKLIDSTVKDGGVLALLYFDLHGKEKGALQKLGVSFVQKVLREPGMKYARGEIDEPVERDGMFSTSMEMKVLTQDLISLARICATYSPFSIEILKPGEFLLDISQLHELLMFLGATTHDYKKYIMEKVATAEDRENYRRTLEQRVKLGEKLMKKGAE